jgi:hypothetical protein
MDKTNNLEKPVSSLQEIIIGSYTDDQLYQALQLIHKILTKYSSSSRR